ncbi:pentapeptide repeat-containing protein [Acinetobacter baumannii]|uniref:Pentapeptide repeats family protein n=2 Tax=Acinetobacter baumannii TaxID=470 RepID=A0A836YNQ0_ACIBA|nr:pentapeptide repeat-containing protein [Acinetobacter baumannii]EXC36270.1 pentapeptide repeats family protein [Acinetobacter baumannii 951631]EXG10628.1 pentapeptide repeats family protein [Acinetobacter baumannii 722310]EXQ92604.1 pentapeptide repeats family protein [Acinetobacter baumannii 1170863]KCX80469.1 pentapeptide repeats family protein [Acinetobacter baumannii 754286]KCY00591.1 pentapeptide repeats family protein [Acinetobacter baumannii 1499986]
MTQKFEIKNRWTEEVLFTCDVPDGMESGMIARHALESAIVAGANLRGANLRGADLYGANLRGANLRGADLSGANLRGANLSGADLYGANLRGADLRGADLSGADLSGADLRDANLRDANLRGADLSGADLYGANLSCAKASPLIVYGLRWDVIISGLGKMRIGCQEHSIEDWKSFDDARITGMDSEALEFWNQHKSMLLNMCDSYSSGGI